MNLRYTENSACMQNYFRTIFAKLHVYRIILENYLMENAGELAFWLEKLHSKRFLVKDSPRMP